MASTPLDVAAARMTNVQVALAAQGFADANGFIPAEHAVHHDPRCCTPPPWRSPPRQLRRIESDFAAVGDQDFADGHPAADRPRPDHINDDLPGKPPTGRYDRFSMRSARPNRPRRCGGIGRHARLRGVWLRPCEFKSRHRLPFLGQSHSGRSRARHRSRQQRSGRAHHLGASTG